MRFLRAITRLQVASALAVFGIALALMPIGLEAIGYEVSRRQGYAILALTALLIAAGIVVFFWPWIRGAWSWLRRDAQRDQLAARARTLELERNDLQEQIAKLHSQVAPPPLGELKPLCLHLAEELEWEATVYKDGEHAIQIWIPDLKEKGLSEDEIDEKVEDARYNNARRALNRYNKHLKGRLLNLYDVLGPQGWFSPADRSSFENLNDPYYLPNLAKRLREVCGKLSGDHENEVRIERLEEELRETEQEHDELKRENKRLVEESENRPDPLPETLAEWEEKNPLITVSKRTYRNDRIELDGNHYVRCVFIACTFSFKGTKPFRVAETCRVEEPYFIDAPAPQALAILRFLQSLDALPDTEYRDPIDGELVD